MNFQPNQIIFLISLNAYEEADVHTYSILEDYGFSAEDIVKIAQKSCLNSLKKLLMLIPDQNGEAVFDENYLVTTHLSELFSAGITNAMIVNTISDADLTSLQDLLSPIPDVSGTGLFDERGLAVTPLTYLKSAGFAGDTLLAALEHMAFLKDSFFPMKDAQGEYVIENNQPFTRLMALTDAGFTSEMLLSILRSSSPNNFSRLLTLLNPSTLPGVLNPYNQISTNLALILSAGFKAEALPSVLRKKGGWLNINKLVGLLRPLENSEEKPQFDNQLAILIDVGFHHAIIIQTLESPTGADNLDAFISMVSKKEISDFIKKYPNALEIIAPLGFKRGWYRGIKILDSILSNREFRAYISENQALSHLCNKIQLKTDVPQDLEALKTLCSNFKSQKMESSSTFMKRKQQEQPEEELTPASKIGQPASSSAHAQGLFPLRKINPVPPVNKDIGFRPI